MLLARAWIVSDSAIDLNCDLGEGGGNDTLVLPLITSANVSCGEHAGDAATAILTLRLAKQFGVTAGAHPGYPDREHFGRRELPRSSEQLFAECATQIGALIEWAKRSAVEVRYLKPHGGLYHQACREDTYAEVLVQVARRFELSLVGLPDSRLQVRSWGQCRFIAEGFADRRYRPDGTLVPRERPDALIDDPVEAATQVERLIQERKIETICVHGDNPEALAFVQVVREHLLRNGFRIRSFA